MLYYLSSLYNLHSLVSLSFVFVLFLKLFELIIGITKENVRFGVMSYKKENKGSEIFCNAIENSVNVFKDVLVQDKIENPEKYEDKKK
jgi:hypothetical protein